MVRFVSVRPLGVHGSVARHLHEEPVRRHPGVVVDLVREPAPSGDAVADTRPSRPPPKNQFDAFLSQSPSRATRLWLAFSRAHAAQQTARGLVKRFSDEPIAAPSPFDLRVIARLDHHALEAAQGYEALLLGLVAPLGTCSAIAPTSQNGTLSTARGFEVVSDPTNVLALRSVHPARSRGGRRARRRRAHTYAPRAGANTARLRPALLRGCA